jgi:histidinol-phosphate aminotransferase
LLAGATVREAPLAGWTADGEALADAVTPRTAMVLVANPNNPTSTALRAAEVERLIDSVPERVLIVVDEAYHEYVTDPDVPDALDRFGGRPNVAVLRTFSKAWSLAGLRVGYLVGHPDVVRAVDTSVIPFVVSAPAQAAALAALDQRDEVARRAGLVVAERSRVRDALLERGVAVPDSQSNFVWLPFGTHSRALAAAMERAGVITRPFPDGVRVTIGTPDDNDLFLDALDGALAQVDSLATTP